MTRIDTIIEVTKNYVKATLKDSEGGHDWFHTLRVYNNAKLIAENEKVDNYIVALGALLHDIADSKFHNGDDTVGPNMARDFLVSHNVGSSVIDSVIDIIINISFNKSLDNNKNCNSPELDVVQDADRLDAIGAIGIARCFNYGGFKNRKLFDPSIKPNMNLSKNEYKNSTAPTINHFYEKLLLLSDKMNTKTGKKIAENRHQFMMEYLDQFKAEWDGNK
ncbi:MAG: hypothetical protein ACI8PF_000645 [Flavobacteriaceae bacterium]|jgi:uncharacterized protein|tara:strand:- start:3712 stop:4371 length:660 start_codon:yes stop_codon:yes gene_type:complete